MGFSLVLVFAQAKDLNSPESRFLSSVKPKARLQKAKVDKKGGFKKKTSLEKKWEAKSEPEIETKNQSEASLKPLKKLNILKRDSDYYVKSLAPKYDIIVSEEFQSLYPLLESHITSSSQKLSQVFPTHPYYRTNNIYISSPYVQFSNAFAKVVPMPFINLFPSVDIQFLDLYSLYNWSGDVLLHEMSHIYQFSQNSKLDRIIWPWFNVFTYRNSFLPLWIFEGHSVLIESLYGSGGRLYSGFTRALVFAQIKEQAISLKSLFRNRDDIFFLEEVYFHGAYFWAYLHSLYGESAYELFYNSSTKWPFVPFDYVGLNASFKKTFQKSVQELFEGYKKHYLSQAQNQKFLKPEPLLKSKRFTRISGDEESLYFLISDTKTPSELVVFDKKSQKITTKKSYLPFGQLFKRGEKFVSAGSFRTSTVSVEYGLSDESFKPLSDYNSQQLLEIKGDQSLSLDAQNSHKGNALLLNKEFYDWTHSSAVRDSLGSIYYFKQSGNLRTLYKNKKPVISFPAYFSYPVEADTEGIYFIAPTAYGSSLFVYSNREAKMYRLSDSDRIVFARKINNQEFLVSEISPQHYEYKILKAKKIKDKPYLYKYSFQKESLFDKAPVFVEKDIENPSPIKKYHSLKDLRLLNFNLIAQGEPTNWWINGVFNFADPLSYNTLNLTSQLQGVLLETENFSLKNLFFYNGKLSYSYNRYRPAFSFSVNYDKSFLNLKPDKALFLESGAVGGSIDDLKPDTESALQRTEESYKEKYETDKYERDEKLMETLMDLDFLDKKDIDSARQNRQSYIETQDRSLNFLVSYPLFRDSLSAWLSKLSMDIGQRRFFDQDPWKNYTRMGLGTVLYF